MQKYHKWKKKTSSDYKTFRKYILDAKVKQKRYFMNLMFQDL